MDTWSRLTGVKGEGGWGDWINKVKGLAKEPIGIAHRHRQWCGEGQGKGRQGWVQVGKGAGEWRTSVVESILMF